MKKTTLKVFTFILTIIIALSAFSITSYARQAPPRSYEEIFFKLDGIEGESNDSKHSKWIEVADFSHGSAQSVQTGLPDVSGRGVFEPFVIKHYIDKSTPKFQEACMKGMRIGNGELHICSPVAGAQTVVYKVKLEGIKIVSAIVSTETDADGNTHVVEEVKLLVNKQTWTATTIGLDNSNGGNTEACYDQIKKATIFDDGANILTVALAGVSFVLAVALVIVLVKKKQDAKVVTNSASESDK